MGKAAKRVIVLGAVVVALPLLAVMFFYVLLNGGIHGTILRIKPRPNPENPGIKRDRATLEADLDGAFQRVVANMDIAYYAESKHDVCYDGENNFMRSEGYAHRCTLQVTRFYGFDGDFRERMINFEKGIISAGWHLGLGNGDGRIRSTGDGMEGYMLNYYDARPNVTVDQIAGPLGYSKGPFDLRINWAERNTTQRLSLELLQNATGNLNRFYDERNFQNINDLFRRMTRDHRYVLAIAIKGNYFEN
ncbi:hypothetical protein [Bradyrhizobium sp. SZCCHNS1054]|uniref:hypothetical protein n=1 Tax=Bradyrhizobium sp. SZCCHNS1054 TaxID=3057301 RepID=UPI0029168EC2|nr:hypothetical protein [Bradyrhizobium sp. SZCCHNS1054]